MRLVWTVASLLMVFWLQAFFLSTVRPLGVVPNLFLVFIVYLSLLRPASETLVTAVAGGLLLDLMSGTDFGLRMAFFSALALAVIVLRQLGAGYENPGVTLIYVAGGTIFYNLAVLASLAINRIPLAAAPVVTKIAIELVFNLILALLLRGIFSKYSAEAQAGVRHG